jgi:hypothetical protein
MTGKSNTENFFDWKFFEFIIEPIFIIKEIKKKKKKKENC